MINRWLVAAVVLACAGAFVAPAVADAATSTVCSVDMPVTGDVDGNVTVPAGSGCDLNQVTVHGSVTAGPGSQVRATGAHIDGEVTVGFHGGIEMRDTAVDGDISVDYADTLGIEYGSVVGGDVHGTFKQDSPIQECDFLVYRSAVRGSLDVATSGIFRSVCINQATIGRNLVIADGALAIDGSSIGGNVVLSAARSFVQVKEERNGYLPSSFCSSTVAGNVTLKDSFAHVLLGGFCGERLDVHGSLIIQNNHNWVHVSAHVHGNVVCRDNRHHPIAGHPTSEHLQNIVDGHLLGQCVDLAVRP